MIAVETIQQVTDATILEGIRTLERIGKARPDGEVIEPILNRLYDDLETRQGKEARRAQIKSGVWDAAA